MNINTEILQIVSEIGYMACFQGDAERSQAIMAGVDAISTPQAPVKVGLAITKLYAGDIDTAIAILRDDVLVKEPEHMSAKCFLGIALKMQGKEDEARNLFSDVAERGTPDEKSIANAYLE